MNNAPASENLTGLTREALTARVTAWGFKPGQGERLFNGLHRGLVDRPARIDGLNRGLVARLEGEGGVAWPGVVADETSADGARKWLLAMADGAHVECVFIPEGNRGTLCLSSQVGCTLACKVCYTGTQGLERNLEAHEIVGQALMIRRLLEEDGKTVTNVVMQGMGEPLYNWPAVKQALQVVREGMGLLHGARKISVSTAGVAPLFREVVEGLGANLAVSLHAADDRVRDEIMPINRKFPLAALREAALDCPLKGGRTVSWAYLLLEGVNDAAGDAEKLVSFVDGIPSRINLLGYNPWPGGSYRPAPPEGMERFRNILSGAGLVTTVRKSRGGDILAACGQLRGKPA